MVYSYTYSLKAYDKTIVAITYIDYVRGIFQKVYIHNQYYIDKFPSEDNLGFISDPKDLLKKVEVIWINKYGERIKKQKPYQVFYDKANGIWLVQGTLRSNMTGGVANILVDNDTGRVLALWHDK